MSQDEIEDILARAISLVQRHDLELLRWGVHERSIMHRFGVYLESDRRLREYSIDCEYNRQGVEGTSKTGFEDERRFPDLVVHERGHNLNNLLIIEAKYDHHSKNEIADDEWKLQQIAMLYNYRFAYYVTLSKAEKANITFQRMNKV